MVATNGVNGEHHVNGHSNGSNGVKTFTKAPIKPVCSLLDAVWPGIELGNSLRRRRLSEATMASKASSRPTSRSLTSSSPRPRTI